MSFSGQHRTHRRATRAGTRTRKDTDHDRTYDAQARGRDGETQIGRHGALCSGPSSLRILTSTHTGGNRSLFTRLRLSSETTTASDDPEKVRRFRHRDHTSADGLGFQVTIEDEPALLRRSARTGGQDHQTPSRTIFPPTPTPPSFTRYAFTCQVPIGIQETPQSFRP
jgi:hypothetical protein